MGAKPNHVLRKTLLDSPYAYPGGGLGLVGLRFLQVWMDAEID